MGGMGSGRRYQGGKDTTDDYRTLDVRWLQRRNLLTPGLFFGLDWTRNGQPLTSIQMQAETDKLILTYRHRSNGGEWQNKECPVQLSWSPCNYGGLRAWFVCPASGCGRRVAKLYLGGSGSFACRHCNHLVYSCQRETVADRALRLTRSIREELGWKQSLLDHNVLKPKGMHWETYRRLRTKHDALVTDYLVGAAKRLGLLNRQLGCIRDDLNGGD